jgi:hypothetical protein
LLQKWSGSRKERLARELTPEEAGA